MAKFKYSPELECMLIKFKALIQATTFLDDTDIETELRHQLLQIIDGDIDKVMREFNER